MSEITLPSGRRIGDGDPVFIIAEIGSNWQTLQDCKDAVVKAKQCGADAVKFQLFDEKALYGRVINFGWQPGQLDPAWLPSLKEKADAVGIEFMCTAFSPELYDAVNPYVSIHKVASAECNHLRLLEKLKSYGKPVILSTGAHGERDIQWALNVLRETPKVLMYCVAGYPARVVNLELMPQLAVLNKLVGYSDHTTDALVIPDEAVKRGACVIEKHVTFINAQTPDAPHSLTGDEFQLMVKRLRNHPISALGASPEEKGMILRHNRRLIATSDIKPGEQFKEGVNFGIYRSLKDDAHAFHPFMIDEVNGRLAMKGIQAGDGIGPGDV